MQNKLLGMLGLCKKAGYLLQGSDRVAEAARAGSVFLILLTQDLSSGSADKLKYIANANNIPCHTITETMQQIERLTGKRAGILGIVDEGFAKKIPQLIIQESN